MPSLKSTIGKNFGLTLVTASCLLLSPISHGAVYDILPGQDVVGEVQYTTTKYEDTFLVVAQKFDIAYRELIAANPTVDPWIPGEGTKVVIPSQYILPSGPRQGIVINLPELRLYYFTPDGKRVYTYPIAIGTEGTPTPVYSGRISAKQADPTWYVPDSIYEKHIMEGNPVPRMVPPGPENPLGKFALRLNLPGYLIHGTNRPLSVGQRISNGCIRLYPEDIKELYPMVTPGIAARIIHEPYKTGWDNKGTFYLEAHQPLSEFEIAGDKLDTNELLQTIDEAIEKRPTGVSWQTVSQISKAQLGIPAQINEIPQPFRSEKVATN